MVKEHNNIAFFVKYISTSGSDSCQDKLFE